MSTEDLKIDLDRLKQLAEDLHLLEKELNDADDRSEDAADAVRHDQLGDRVREFADGWRVKRENMIENVTTLRTNLSAVSDTFREVDAELAKSLEEQPSSTPVRSTTGQRGRSVA